MNLTQLWATGQSGDKVLIDLYEGNTIKLTFTAETLTDFTRIDSTFSQNFRVPATANNQRLFKYWFNVNINDFDISKIVPAEIVTDQGQFTVGYIRLNKVFINDSLDAIDYEVLFLGSVKDFATQLGDINMNDLPNDELVHFLNYSNITTSWNASPGTTNGLFNGNVLYPLVDYGYAYNSAGNLDNDSYITAATGVPGPIGSEIKVFNDITYPLPQGKFKPWIRAKWLIDKLFDQTNYTYESSFLDSDLFDQLYINATGNTASSSLDDELSTNRLGIIGSSGEFFFTNPGGDFNPYSNTNPFNPVITLDDGSNFNANTGIYNVPITGNYQFNNKFEIFVNAINTSGGSCGTPAMTAQYWYKINGTKTAIGSLSNTLPFTPFVQGSIPYTGTLTLTTGDTLEFGYTLTVTEPAGCDYTYRVVQQGTDNFFNIVVAPFTVDPVKLLPNNVKLIDWFRGILTQFRLIMNPKRDNPDVFIIEPWEDYIGSGLELDWTAKRDLSKDVRFEPVFFDQSESILFTSPEGVDYKNERFVNLNNETLGTLRLDYNNELLKDTREILSTFVPTPLSSMIAGGSDIIPIIHQRETQEESTWIKYLPVIAGPRLLFYNGLTISTLGTWYLEDDTLTAQAQTQFPQLTYLSEFPATSTATNLNWRIEDDNRYQEAFIQDITSGESVYQMYWENYVNSIYNIDARKQTAYFYLTAEDLRVEFKDNIFIKDSWWRILKIYDAPVNGGSVIKVDLIKLINGPGNCNCQQYFVVDGRESPTNADVSYTDCEGVSQTITVNNNAFAVCACQPFSSGVPGISVSLAGACPSTGGGSNKTVNLVADSTSEFNSILNIEWSSDGVNWGTGISYEVNSLATLDVNLTIPVGSAVRITNGYIGEQNYFDVIWSKNTVPYTNQPGTSYDTLGSPEGWVYSPELLTLDDTYSVTVDIADVPFE